MNKFDGENQDAVNPGSEAAPADAGADAGTSPESPDPGSSTSGDTSAS